MRGKFDGVDIIHVHYRYLITMQMAVLNTDVKDHLQMVSAMQAQNIVRSSIELALIHAEACSNEYDYERASEWVYIAATMGWGIFPGYFHSAKLTHVVDSIGKAVNNENLSIVKDRRAKSYSEENSYLHVISVASGTGGHTRVLERWIENCKKYLPVQRHSLCITQQSKTEIPPWLISLIHGGTGEIEILPCNLSILEKAVALRKLAVHYQNVVLHIHPNDVIPNIAFSGPPISTRVFFFNHADHVFSTGISVSNVVLNFRLSGQALSLRERCVNNNYILPIPLPDNEISNSDLLLQKANIRDELGIETHAKVILTVGDEYKYKSVLGYNFKQCVRKILESDQSIYIYAVGIPYKGEWKNLSLESSGRFRAIGKIKDRTLLQNYYRLADVYMEGFPFSSITAMLEAGLNMLPIQRMHNVQIPILSGDDIALDNLVSIATTEDEYVSGVLKLANMPIEERINLGNKIQSSIIQVHCGKQWINNYLETILSNSDSKVVVENINMSNVQRISEEESLNLTLIQWINQGAVSMCISSLINNSILPFDLLKMGRIILSNINSQLSIHQRWKLHLYLIAICLAKLLPNTFYNKVRLIMKIS